MRPSKPMTKEKAKAILNKSRKKYTSKDYVITTITIRADQKAFIDENNLSLSDLVKNHLDELIESSSE